MLIFFKILAFRILNTLIVRTYFAPDEYWQAPEIAHSDIFENGYKTWEWVQEDGPIRSPFYHFISYSIPFYLLKIFNMDDPTVIAYLPRVISAIYAAVFDLYMIKILKFVNKKWNIVNTDNNNKKNNIKKQLSQQKQSNNDNNIIYYIVFFNWFSLFAMPRTIINSFEAMLFAIAFYHQLIYLQIGNQENNKFQQQQILNKNNLICRIFVSINFIARPTSIIPWVFIWPYEIIQRKFNKFFKIIALNIANLILMSIFSIVIDTMYFKQITWSAYNFLKFNLIEGGAELYGTHELFWYFNRGLPYLLLGFVVFFINGILYELKNKRMMLLMYLLFPILFMTLSKHKEDRFLLPLYPIIQIFTFQGFQSFAFKKLKNVLLFIAILSNIILFCYMGLFHNSGSIQIMDDLRNELQQQNKIQQQQIQQNILFLTECHQTPFYSFLHQKKLYMKFPDCSPQNRKSGNWESLQLFSDTLKFVQKEMEIFNRNYNYIIVYSNLLRKNDYEISNYLADYSEISRVYHSKFMETPLEEIYNVEFVLLKKQ